MIGSVWWLIWSLVCPSPNGCFVGTFPSRGDGPWPMPECLQPSSRRWTMMKETVYIMENTSNQHTHTHPWISLQDASIMCHSARVQAKGRSLAAFAGTLGPQFGFEHGLPPILKGVNYLVCPLRLISIAILCHLRVYPFLHKPTASFSLQPQATPATSTPPPPFEVKILMMLYLVNAVKKQNCLVS